MIAKHPGACQACPEPIKEGDEIVWKKYHGARHLQCVERQLELEANEPATRRQIEFIRHLESVLQVDVNEGLLATRKLASEVIGVMLPVAKEREHNRKGRSRT